jgi:hypothetical protein
MEQFAIYGAKLRCGRHPPKSKLVQKLPPPEKPSINLGQARFIADRIPLPLYYLNLGLNDPARLLSPDQKLIRCQQTEL